MVEIKVKAQIDAPLERVWDVVSRMDDDPKFWKGTKSIRNISKEGNEILREVIIGKVNKCHQKVTLIPKEGVNILWTKGVVTGTKDIILISLGGKTLLEVSMNYTFSGPARFFSGRTADELRAEAELAVDLIKEKSEGRSYSVPMVERKSWADLIRG